MSPPERYMFMGQKPSGSFTGSFAESGLWGKVWQSSMRIALPEALKRLAQYETLCELPQLSIFTPSNPVDTM
eukprot:CAMPEP_0180561562 /NCGR_PEP_ID=MMETSP1037_2-20121125/3448_1 /TAXON_ID=632150 /ORGANISM="Azadinium spinosum, Strain 3D9" /LENGTH=71 /DNA_ID=CAMNT_0022578213 /DNA_START=699 /DNA_END=914 /DNA_ORIENTATION=-